MCEHITRSGERMATSSQKLSQTATESNKQKNNDSVHQEKSNKQRSTNQCLQCLAEKMNKTAIADSQQATVVDVTSNSHSVHDIEEAEENELEEDSANEDESSSKNEYVDEEGSEEQQTESSEEEEEAEEEEKSQPLTEVNNRQRSQRLQHKAVQTERSEEQQHDDMTDGSEEQSESEKADVPVSSKRPGGRKSIAASRDRSAKHVARVDEPKKVRKSNNAASRGDADTSDEPEQSKGNKMNETPKRNARLSALTKTPKNAALEESQESTPTSKKFDSFINKPIGELSVYHLPGVGKSFGQVLVDKGFTDAESILAVFLGFKRNENSYADWLIKQGCKQSNRAEECAQALSAWCRMHLCDPEPTPTKRKNKATQ